MFMNFCRYASFLSKHAGKFLICIAVFSVVISIAGLVIIPFPDFSDPTKGFESRGTDVMEKALVFENFINSRKFYRFETENAALDKVNFSTPSRQHREADSSRFCSKLHFGDGFTEYSQLVFEVDYPIFTVEFLQNLCKFESAISDAFLEREFYQRNCVTVAQESCCEPWSFFTVFKFLSDFDGTGGGGEEGGVERSRYRCEQISLESVDIFAQIIRNCSQFSSEIYDCNLELNLKPKQCKELIPKICRKPAIYWLFAYILPENSVKNLAANASEIVGPILSILPFAQSSAWAKHRRLALKFSSFAKQFNLRLIGTKFGIRFELFHRFLLEDSKFGFVAFALVFLIAWIYTGSLAFTGFSLIGILFSFGKKHSSFIPSFISHLHSTSLDLILHIDSFYSLPSFLLGSY